MTSGAVPRHGDVATQREAFLFRHLEGWQASQCALVAMFVADYGTD